MSYTPYQAPFNAALLGHDETAALFSPRAEIAAMLRFEAALAEAQADAGSIDRDAARTIAEALPSFRPDMDALRVGGGRDGVIVPALVRLLREHVGEPHGASVHFGTTSQDVIDSAAMMRLRDAVALHVAALEAAIAMLHHLQETVGERPIMLRTRMRHAYSGRLTDRLENWLAGLTDALDSAPQRFPLQLGGPDGTLSAMYGHAPEIAVGVAERLGLAAPVRHWQTNRFPMIVIAQWFANTCGACGKIGQDVALMVQDEIAEVRVRGAGGSSAMAHKQNPVKAEALVTLARFAATLVGGMNQAQVHEYERSGAAWALEWMLVPQLAVTCGAATRTVNELLGALEFDD